MNQTVATENCIRQFNGRLFEPKSVGANNAVYHLAVATAGHSERYWIGVDAIGRPGKKSSYHYSSTNYYPSGVIDGVGYADPMT